MSKIYQDEKGLYANVGGWVARPVDNVSAFSVGDEPTGKHFGGSPIIGMGKLPGRGKYQEYWRTAGMQLVNSANGAKND